MNKGNHAKTREKKKKKMVEGLFPGLYRMCKTYLK